MKKIVIGVTGASGHFYAYRLIQNLLQYNCEVHLVFSEQGEKVFAYELGASFETLLTDLHHPNLNIYDNSNLFAPIASGSFKTDAMVVVPCSMGTVASLANGLSHSLLTRAADVTLKERRPLIVVARETPLSSIHLKNLLTLSESGATIFPPMPAYYHLPQNLEEILNATVGRLLSQLGIDNSLYPVWGTSKND